MEVVAGAGATSEEAAGVRGLVQAKWRRGLLVHLIPTKGLLSLGKGASKTVLRDFDEYEGIDVAWNQHVANEDVDGVPRLALRKGCRTRGVDDGVPNVEEGVPNADDWWWWWCLAVVLRSEEGAPDFRERVEREKKMRKVKKLVVVRGR
ncbi:hypothetical protein L1987_11445 [Smallanthus sonchifolius]|uniref:Uncharacterized protein n=1 Tax=Smallanthus sonchifolius TaxID=185202 RepID=A0ACB9JBG9_9ASTR|nr:hypothetical protein L1987_11445 [Smallanthus sonchifolius]